MKWCLECRWISRRLLLGWVSLCGALALCFPGGGLYAATQKIPPAAPKKAAARGGTEEEESGQEGDSNPAKAKKKSPSRIKKTSPNDVLPTKRRQDLLSKTESYLTRKDESFLEVIPNLGSPFSINRGDMGESTFIAPQGYIPSDRDILFQAAQKINPTGVVMKEGEGYLILEKGRQLCAGNHFMVKVQGKAYTVTIDKVTRKYFILKRNATTIKRELK